MILIICIEPQSLPCQIPEHYKTDVTEVDIHNHDTNIDHTIIQEDIRERIQHEDDAVDSGMLTFIDIIRISVTILDLNINCNLCDIGAAHILILK